MLFHVCYVFELHVILLRKGCFPNDITNYTIINMQQESDMFKQLCYQTAFKSVP